MDITHNDINKAIGNMWNIVDKGQPFAKRNKDRRIRAVLHSMMIEQVETITFKEVWFYFMVWIRVKRLDK